MSVGQDQQSEDVPSPSATGGAGGLFEQRLDAYALALLLVRSGMPLAPDSPVEQVHFQTRHMGWRTDDLLIVGRAGPELMRKLAIQAKRSFTVSASDDACVETVRGMWDDFKASDRFDSEVDRLAVVTLHGTSTLLSAFGSLLDCARAAPDAEDFFRRVGLDGYLSKKARSQNDVLRSIIAGHASDTLSDEEHWRFLRAINVLSMDLGTATSHTEALVIALLRHTAHGPGAPLVAARGTWNALVKLATETRPTAASLSREDLPEELVHRHLTVPDSDERARLDLVVHGRVVRDRIRAALGSGHVVDRSRQVAALRDRVDEEQVVIVSGAAGVGKSALVKTLLERVEHERPVFAFQAVEFATAHINQTLASTQSALNVVGFFALLASHDRTLILIDGLERLLEHPVRDAFSHLLDEVAKRPPVRLLLTCRDYSLETVRRALLGQADLEHRVFEVEEITDEELDALAQACVPLRPVLRNPRMRGFLRTPHLLDLAARLEWSPERLPQTVRAFRERCWQDLVRDDAHPSGGMPRRREEALLEVARLRATELRPFVRPETQDLDALDRLRASSILQCSPESDRLYAPAHDVWEDWAILRWLDETWSSSEDGTVDLAEAVGGLPAMRRGLRKWIAERLDMDPQGTQRMVLSALDRNDLPQHFLDDCLVSVLLSDSAPQFLEGCRARIVAGDTPLLREVVHLLRVACKMSPTRLPKGAASSILLVPEGPAWAPALELVSSTFDLTEPSDALLALGLAEDWARQIAIAEPTPDGADAAGSIVSQLVRTFGGYGAREQRKRALSVLLKIPRHAPAFEDLSRKALDSDDHDVATTDFSDLITSTTGCAYASRDFPQVVIDVLKARILLRDTGMPRFSGSPDVDDCFGMQEPGVGSFFPPSAVQGPFWALLRHHPRAGLDLILELLNHAGEWYGLRKWPGHDLEPAEKVTLNVPGGKAVEQWLNDRLFALYRGMSVGPYALQSALMALEDWFLKAAERPDFPLERWLIYTLTHSNNVMASGVVASICAAHPERAGRAALTLLSCRAIIECDRSRLAAETSTRVGANLFNGLDSSHQLHESDRERSNDLPHRREDLEAVATRLQLTDRREDVWAIIDRHRDELEAESSESDSRIWRLALHRMDVRGFKPVDPPVESPQAKADNQRRVYLRPGELEPDVQEMVDEAEGRLAELNRHLALQTAGRAQWDDRNAPQAQDWRDFLEQARKLEKEVPPPERYAAGGPGLMAAVALRDHLGELSPEELEWCAGRIVSELGEDDDGLGAHQRSGLLGPDRAAAAILPLLVAEAPESLPGESVELLVYALAHEDEDVVDQAYLGAGVFLSPPHRDLMLRFAAAAVAEAELRGAWHATSRPWEPTEPSTVEQRRREFKSAVRAALVSDVSVAQARLDSLAYDTWYARKAALRVSGVLGNHPDWEEAREFYQRAARWLASEWLSGRPHHSGRQRDYRHERNLSRRVAAFALKLGRDAASELCEPLCALAESEPREVEVFVHDLISVADGGSDDSFWTVWQLFADEVVEAPWTDRLDREHPVGAELVGRLFLTTYWKEGADHWERLDGEAHRIHALVRALPTSVATLEPYTRFLYTIGQRSLPDAFKVVDEVLAREKGTRVAASSNIAFYLEFLLGRFVYGQPLRLKSDPGLRAAVLRLLDCLVAAGSSAAYRMRDDFVTPLRVLGKG